MVYTVRRLRFVEFALAAMTIVSIGLLTTQADASAVDDAAAACQAAGYRFQRGTAVAAIQCLSQQTEARLTRFPQYADIRQAASATALALATEVDHGQLTSEQATTQISAIIAQANTLVRERQITQVQQQAVTNQNLANMATTLLQMGQPSQLPYGAYRLGPPTLSCTYGGGYMNCH
jgi:hypothetical protein